MAITGDSRALPPVQGTNEPLSPTTWELQHSTGRILGTSCLLHPQGWATQLGHWIAV
jgi:hypothetical protein